MQRRVLGLHVQAAGVRHAERLLAVQGHHHHLSLSSALVSGALWSQLPDPPEKYPAGEAEGTTLQSCAQPPPLPGSLSQSGR